MKNIRDNLVRELKNLDRFKHVNKDEVSFDRSRFENQVSEELNHHVNNNSYSNFLKNQIIDLYGQGFVSILGFNHPYEPLDIYYSIDRIVSKKESPKLYRNSLLSAKNIYHSHHSRNFYSLYNCIRYFYSKYKSDDDVLARLAAIQNKHPDREDITILFINEVFLESLKWEKKTGEWIVYREMNEKYHFICLYIHDSNDERLFNLIEKCFYDDDIPF